jgi:anthranilate phosphoribosyltransferase
MQDFLSEAGRRFRTRLIKTAKGSHGAKDMDREQAREALAFLFTAEADPVQVGAFITAMRFKGTRVDEMVGFLDAMEQSATLIKPNAEGLLNVNGPYDGRKKSLHLSLAASIVAVAAGVPIIMHSNTGLLPKDGLTTTHLLEAMGVPAYRAPEAVARDIETVGFGHLHASRYLHGVERLKPARQALFYRSFLHACEVVLNPAQAEISLFGAAHSHFLERFVTAAVERGQKRVMAVQGLDGGEELPLKSVAVVEYKAGELKKYNLNPAEFGLAEREHAPCQSAEQTAVITQQLLLGADAQHLDQVLLNAGVRIYLGGVAADLEAGIEMARQTISSGAAAERLNLLLGK